MPDRLAEPVEVRALRQARADMGCCATAFRKMEQGTEEAPVHCRREDAERALARIDAALGAVAPTVEVTDAAREFIESQGKRLIIGVERGGLALSTVEASDVF